MIDSLDAFGDIAFGLSVVIAFAWAIKPQRTPEPGAHGQPAPHQSPRHSSPKMTPGDAGSLVFRKRVKA